jgi:hypothetical protein
LAEFGLVGAITLVWLLWRIFGILLAAGREIQKQQLWERRSWHLTVSIYIFVLFTSLFAIPILEPAEMAFLMIVLALVRRFLNERVLAVDLSLASQIE